MLRVCVCGGVCTHVRIELLTVSHFKRISRQDREGPTKPRVQEERGGLGNWVWGQEELRHMGFASGDRKRQCGPASSTERLAQSVSRRKSPAATQKEGGEKS